MSHQLASCFTTAISVRFLERRQKYTQSDQINCRRGGGGRRYASSAELCGEDRTSDGRPANCGRTPPRPSPPYAPSTHRGPDGGQYSPQALLNVNYLAFIILAVALLRFASKVKCVTIKIDYCYYYYCLMVISNLYLIILTLQPEPQR